MKTAHVLMWPLAIPLMFLSGCETTQKQAFGSVAQSYAGGLVAMFSESAAEKREQEEMDRLIEEAREEGRQRHERHEERERERQESARRVEERQKEREQWLKAEKERQEAREAASRAEREQQNAAKRKADAEQRAAAEREEAEARARAREVLNTRKARRDYQPFPLDNADAAAGWVARRFGGLLEDGTSGNPLRYDQNSWVHTIEIEDLMGQRVTYAFQPMAPSGRQSEMISREGVWVGLERPVDSGFRSPIGLPVYSGIKVPPRHLAFGGDIPVEFAAELDRNSKILVSGRVASVDYVKDDGLEERIVLGRALNGQNVRVAGVMILELQLEDIRVEKVIP